MTEFYWVRKDVLAGRCGPSRKPWDLKALRDFGFGGIISLESDDVDESAIEAQGFLHLPIYRPMVTLETEADHREFLAVMPAALWFIDHCESQGRPVIVHCHYGCDRTGCVLGCYLIAREGLKPLDAYERIKEANPYAFGQSGYAEALLTFDKLLKRHPEWLKEPA